MRASQRGEVSPVESINDLPQLVLESSVRPPASATGRRRGMLSVTSVMVFMSAPCTHVHSALCVSERVIAY